MQTSLSLGHNPRPDIFSFEQGLTIDHDSGSSVPEQEAQPILEEGSAAAVSPLRTSVDPYDGTVLAFAGQIAEKILASLEPEIKNGLLLSPLHFAQIMESACDKLKGLALRKDGNTLLSKAVAVLVIEISLQQELQANKSMLIPA